MTSNDSNLLKQFNENLIELISKLSSEKIFNLIELIYEFKIKSNQIEKILNSNEKSNENLPNLFEQLQCQLKQISNSTQPISSHLLLKQMSPSIISYQNEDEDNDDDNEGDDEEEQEIIEITSDDSVRKSNSKIHLSNNIVRVMRGPLKVMLNGTIHIVENCAKDNPIDENLIKSIQSIQNEISQSPYIEINSDWIYLGENEDKGFTSDSFWMKNPCQQRVLIKCQDLSLCAANEWLAFVLGKHIGLNVNQVQIGIYQNKLVTIHQDVKQENENILTFMDLPKKFQKILLTDPILLTMYFFDKIIQNVDRNPRNILLTHSNTIKLDQDTNIKFKIHFIDHSSAFGMGKLNGISVMASKLHTQHLSIKKFHPNLQAKKFDKFISKIHLNDRVLIKKTLIKFASIDDQLFLCWLNQIQPLLTNSQYQRILRVLILQRDIAKKYIDIWQFNSRQSSSTPTDQNQSVVFF